MNAEITNETSAAADLIHGHTAVGVTTVPLTTLSLKCVRGLLLRAPGPGEDDANTDVVYCGRAAVTADADTNTGGFPILPGSTLFLPVDDPSKVYVVSPSASQSLAWMGV